MMTWPLGVSTLGLPDASVDDVIDVASSARCVALELRAGEGQLAHTAMPASARTELRRRLAEAGLEVLAVCSYVKVCAAGSDDAVVADIVDHVRLAADLGADGVRLFPGGSAGSGAEAAAEERGRRRIASALPAAAESEIRLLVETHGSHRAGADVARLLGPLAGGADGRHVGVIWDVVHTWAAGESPAATAASLADLLAYVQIKDAVPAGGRPLPALPGQGEVPLDEIAHVLRRRAYQGVLSLEWEKAWHPDIPDAREALAAARDWLGTV